MFDGLGIPLKVDFAPILKLPKIGCSQCLHDDIKAKCVMILVDNLHSDHC